MTKNQAVAVGIIDGDKDIFLEHNAVRGQNVDKHTMFELGSTTKEFTGLSILKLEAEGLISTSDAVTKYLEWFTPQYKGSDVVITIDQLMNHSSGIPVYSISLIPEGDESKVTLEETIRKIFRTKDSDREQIIPGRKAGFFYNWKQKAPTYYGNTAAGYPAKIDLCISIHELEDFLFVICTLLILYISLLLKYKHKWVCLCAGIAILAGVIFFPLISHFSYRFLFVWMPFNFTVMISALIAFALRLIVKVKKKYISLIHNL